MDVEGADDAVLGGAQGQVDDRRLVTGQPQQICKRTNQDDFPVPRSPSARTPEMAGSTAVSSNALLNSSCPTIAVKGNCGAEISARSATRELGSTTL